MPGTSFTTSAKIPREVFQTGESRIVGDLMEGNLAGQHDGTISEGRRARFATVALPPDIGARGEDVEEYLVSGVSAAAIRPLDVPAA